MDHEIPPLQGTILGPLLFIVIVNNVPDSCKNSEIKLYPDDSKLYKKIENSDDAALLQMDFLSGVEYLTDWQLSVNSSKTELLHIGQINPGHPYVINQSEISPSIVFRDIGFLMSDDMSFGTHYSKFIRNSSFRLKQFRMSFISRIEISFSSYTLHILDLF